MLGFVLVRQPPEVHTLLAGAREQACCTSVEHCREPCRFWTSYELLSCDLDLVATLILRRKFVVKCALNAIFKTEAAIRIEDVKVEEI